MNGIIKASLYTCVCSALVGADIGPRSSNAPRTQPDTTLLANPATLPIGTADLLPPERVNLEVLKVFFAKDGDAIFRAYLVSWKGQEVIVRDSLATTEYRAGETITVLVMNHPYPNGKEAHRLLNFVVVPKTG